MATILMSRLSQPFTKEFDNGLGGFEKFIWESRFRYNGASISSMAQNAIAYLVVYLFWYVLYLSYVFVNHLTHFLSSDLSVDHARAIDQKSWS